MVSAVRNNTDIIVMQQNAEEDASKTINHLFKFDRFSEGKGLIFLYGDGKNIILMPYPIHYFVRHIISVPQEQKV